MSYSIIRTNRFKKDVAVCRRRGYDMSLLREVLLLLMKDGTVPSRFRPHKLSGRYAGLWECHLRPDWLLVWELRENEVVVVLMNTGTHADIFR